MKNRHRFKRILGLKGINLVQPNPYTIKLLKSINYENNKKAHVILDSLLREPEEDGKSIFIYSSEQSLKIFFYSDSKLAKLERESLINYVELNLKNEDSKT